jgi:hypothetical protein
MTATTDHGALDQRETTVTAGVPRDPDAAIAGLVARAFAADGLDVDLPVLGWRLSDRARVARIIEEANQKAAAAREAAGQKEFEADPNGLAIASGCEVRSGRLNPPERDPDSEEWVSGAMSPGEGASSVWIALEGRDSLRRKRFSLCHEYAHVRSGRKKNEVRRPNDRDPDDLKYLDDKPDEFACDMFAHAYLMPTKAVAAMLMNNFGVLEMADSLKVTESTMKKRLGYFLIEMQDVAT